MVSNLNSGENIRESVGEGVHKMEDIIIDDDDIEPQPLQYVNEVLGHGDDEKW